MYSESPATTCAHLHDWAQFPRNFDGSQGFKTLNSSFLTIISQKNALIMSFTCQILLWLNLALGPYGQLSEYLGDKNANAPYDVGNRVSHIPEQSPDTDRSFREYQQWKGIAGGPNELLAQVYRNSASN